MNNRSRKNLLRNSRNVANMFGNNENVEVVNFNANYTPEAPKNIRRAGLVTPQRPTRNVFGAVGALPSNAPNAPMKNASANNRLIFIDDPKLIRHGKAVANLFGSRGGRR